MKLTKLLIINFYEIINNNNNLNFYKITNFYLFLKLLGIGDWGLGIWGLGVWADPKTPKPKPKNPNPK